MCLLVIFIGLCPGELYDIRSGLELNRQLGGGGFQNGTSPSVIAFRLVTIDLRPDLESAGPADAAGTGTFRLLGKKTGNPVFFC
jgi:hypothetical protein